MIILSKAQYSVCKPLVETGKGDKELARELDLSIPTVKMHLGDARTAVECQTGIRVSNRTQLVLALLREGYEQAKPKG